VPLLGRLPLVPALREGGDNGQPITVADPQSEAAQAFQEIARRIATELRSKKIFNSALKVQ
jgi:ATP-binding protein involved in chromosome partitioning